MSTTTTKKPNRKLRMKIGGRVLLKTREIWDEVKGDDRSIFYRPWIIRQGILLETMGSNVRVQFSEDEHGTAITQWLSTGKHCLQEVEIEMEEVPAEA